MSKGIQPWERKLQFRLRTIANILVGLSATTQMWLHLNPVHHIEKTPLSLEEQVFSLNSTLSCADPLSAISSETPSADWLKSVLVADSPSPRNAHYY